MKEYQAQNWRHKSLYDLVPIKEPYKFILFVVLSMISVLIVSTLLEGKLYDCYISNYSGEGIVCEFK